VPTFTTADPNMQPSDCKGGTGTPMAPKNQGEIDYFNPDTKFPQNFQSDLGVDKRLPWDLIGSVDLLYTHDVNGWYTTDENLQVTGTSGDGRTTYGRFVNNPNAFSVSAVKIDPANLGNAVEVYNKSEGRVWTGTLQLQKRFGRRYEVQVGYTYSNSQDLLSFTSSQAFSNYQFAPLDGTIKERNLRPSAFDRTHKLTVTGTAAIPYGFEVGLTYVGLSGTPYTFVTSGDVNGDGVNGNDLVFVPAKQGDISLKDPTQWDALNKFIDSQDCLASARGRFVQRGECRNPFSNIVNLRLAWGMHTISSQRFLIQLDIFDFLNMFNSDWGTFAQAGTGFETASTFLRAVGYDGANNRPIYSFAPPVDSMGNIKPIATTFYSPTSSRWHTQLGARYEF